MIGAESRTLLQVDELPEIRKLSSNSHPELQDTIKGLKDLLKDYVRGTIYKLLCVNYDYVPPPDIHRPGGDGLLENWSRSKVWIHLSVSERILSRTFWHTLLSFGIFEGPSNLDIQEGWNRDWKIVRLSPQEHHEMELGTYRQIHITDLDRLIRRGNTIKMLAKEEHQPLTLPDRTRSQAYNVPVIHCAPSTEPCESDNDLNCAHPVPSEALAEDCFPALQPSEASSGCAPQDCRFEFDPNVTTDDRPVSWADNPKWPLGGVRKCDWVHAPGNEERQVNTAEVGLETSNDSLDTTADEPETAKYQRQWPPPSGFGSWSSWNLENKLATSGKVEQKVSSLQKNQDERCIPRFSSRRQEKGERWIKKAPKKQNISSDPAMTEFFNLHEFFLQAIAAIEATARRKLQYADCLIREEPHEIGITNTLVCLQDSEWKYLPLWAGGFDDGTGGVFNDQLPAADLGFTTPGPEVHTGSTPANSIRTPSEFSMVDSDDGADTVNTVNTSMVNNRSFAGALHRKRVYAADSMDSTSSDGFDMVTVESDCEEEKARRQTEAQERVEAAEAEAASEARRIEKASARVVDENYADLFNYDEADQTERADDDDDDDDDGDCMMNESDEDGDTVRV